jgi:hypothetical protein
MLYMFDLDLGQARLNPSSVFSGYPVLLLGEKRRLLETGENWYLSVWMSNGYDEILVFFIISSSPFLVLVRAFVWGCRSTYCISLAFFALCSILYSRVQGVRQGKHTGK